MGISLGLPRSRVRLNNESAYALCQDIVVQGLSIEQSGGDAIIVDAVCGVRHVLYCLDLASQTWSPLTDPTADVSFGGWSYSAETDTHVVSAVSQQNGGDIHLVNADQSLTQLTHVFDDLTAKYALPEVRAIQWSGEDGETIEGLLYHPIGHKEGDAPAPLVVST